MALNLKISVYLMIPYLILISEGKRHHIELPTISKKDERTHNSLLSVAAANSKVMEQRILMDEEQLLNEGRQLQQAQQTMDIRHGFISGDKVTFVDSGDGNKVPKPKVEFVPADKNAAHSSKSGGGLNIIKSEQTDSGMIYYFEKTVEHMKDPIVHAGRAPVDAIVHRPPPRMNTGEEVFELQQEHDSTVSVKVAHATTPRTTQVPVKYQIRKKSVTKRPSPQLVTVTYVPSHSTTTHSPSMKATKEPVSVVRHHPTKKPSHRVQGQGRSLQQEHTDQTKSKKKCVKIGEPCRKHGECCQNYCNWYSMKCTEYKKPYYWD